MQIPPASKTSLSAKVTNFPGDTSPQTTPYPPWESGVTSKSVNTTNEVVNPKKTSLSTSFPSKSSAAVLSMPTAPSSEKGKKEPYCISYYNSGKFLQLELNELLSPL